MSAQLPATDARAARHLIEQVRGRLARRHVVRGAALLVAAAAAAVIVSFAIDRVLDLPVAVRAVHLVLLVLGLALFARWVFAPTRVRPTDEAIAQAIEHEVPEFQDRLLSSLDFERRVQDPAEPESREMMAAAMRDAHAIASRIDPHLLVDGRPARRALALAAGALLAVVAVEFAFPEDFRLWLRRAFLLEDVSWPRRTNVVVEGFPPEGPYILTRGDDLRIVARAEGAQPPDLDLHLQELEETEDGEPRVASTDVRKMFPVPDQPGRYAFDFRAVGSSFRFWVTGGDDLDRRPTHEVRALVPPRVGAFSAKVEAPAYTGVAVETIHEPTFEALRGSKVALEFTANMPVVSARLRHTDGRTADLPLDADGRTFRTAFSLAEPDLPAGANAIEFHVELRAAAGQVSRSEDDVFRVDAVTDRAPTVRMLHPHGRIVATPSAIVPVKLFADDDFGVAEAALDMRQGTEGAWTSRIWSPTAREGDPAPKEGETPEPARPERHVHVYRAVDLDVFKGDQGVHVKPGDVLTLVVRAKDAGGQETAGADVPIEIVSPEDLAQRIQTEMQRLREDLGKTRSVQRRAVAALREMQGAGAASSDAAAVRRARDVQVDQGRVVNDTSRFLTGTRRVFDLLVLDRLGSIPTVDRLLPLYHEHLKRPPDDSGDVFPASLYATILEEKRANRLYDPELLGILLDVMDLSDRLREREGPAAQDALEKWANQAEAAAPGLGDAHARARDVLATLDAIDERLQRFDDMSQILQLAKSIRDAQKDLREKAQTPETK